METRSRSFRFTSVYTSTYGRGPTVSCVSYQELEKWMSYLLDIEPEEIAYLVNDAVQSSAPSWGWSPTGMDLKKDHEEGESWSLLGVRTFLVTRMLGTEIPLMVEMYPLVGEDDVRSGPSSPKMRFRTDLPPVRYEVREGDDSVWVKLDRLTVGTSKMFDLHAGQGELRVSIEHQARQHCSGVFRSLFRGPQDIRDTVYQTDEDDVIPWLLE